jgi:uncharacterized protein (TIGR02646 family)
MIKLDRNFTPICLEPSNSKKLTDEFKLNKNSVWNIPEIKNALLETSGSKCAYCECNIKEESKYMEVEHFHDKHTHPEKVVEWENLLPSCKRCNVAKGGHDVTKEPIINPYAIDPKNHLVFRWYRFRGKDKIGESTIEVLDLNNQTRVVPKRFEIGEAIHKGICDALENLNNYNTSKTTRSRNRMISQITELLKECIKTASYAATSATIIHNDPYYLYIKTELIKASLWNEELKELDQESSEISLPTR